MPDLLTWADLVGRRVGIYGFGVEGRANLRACHHLGLEPVLVDDRPQDGMPSVIGTHEGGLTALLTCEIVVVAPGISVYADEVRTLRASGVQVVGGLGLWLAGADRRRVICITGTKGKSTTSSLVGHLLNHWGYRCMVGGNIGLAPWDPEAGSDYDYWVIEVSSYQATSLQVAPAVTVVTSLNPDHLPWHEGNLETYYRDKLSLCTRPGAEVAVANGESPDLRAHADLLGPRVHWVTAADVEVEDWVDDVPLMGRHNRLNAVLAVAALREAGVSQASDPAALRSAARSFQPLEHRLTPVTTVDGVTFIDDGLATNVLPTIAALEAFPDRRTALIVGGQDRGIDYRPLGRFVRDRGADTLLLTIQDVGPRIAAEVAIELVGSGWAVRECASLEEAVSAGFEWARPGGVVLLSPAAPSFGIYRDYKERAAAFVAAALAIAARP